MQPLVTNGIVPTSRLSLHRVSLQQEFTVELMFPVEEPSVKQNTSYVSGLFRDSGMEKLQMPVFNFVNGLDIVPRLLGNTAIGVIVTVSFLQIYFFLFDPCHLFSLRIILEEDFPFREKASRCSAASATV